MQTATAIGEMDSYNMEQKLLNTPGKRVRALRMDLNYTQIELAERMAAAGTPIGQTYISDIERSGNLPGGDVLKTLADVLGTTMDYIAMRTDTPFSSQDETESYLTPEADDAALLVDKAPPLLRRQMTAVLKTMSSFATDIAASSKAQPSDTPFTVALYELLELIERSAGSETRRRLEQPLLQHFRRQNRNSSHISDERKEDLDLGIYR